MIVQEIALKSNKKEVVDILSSLHRLHYYEPGYILSKNIHPLVYEHIINGRGQTKIIEENNLSELFKFVEKEIYKGKQAYVILPLIDDSEKLNLNLI